MTSVTVDPGAVRLCLEEEGSGPPLIWAHPLMSSMEADDRAGIFDWSSAGHRLIRYDARSHGRSSYDPRAENHRWPVLASDLWAVADQAGVSTAVLGGASMGAATSLWAACLAPDRVRGLVLVIPPTAGESRAAQARIYRWLGMASATRMLLAPSLALRLPRPSPDRGTRGALTDAVLREVGQKPSHHLAPPLRGAADSDLPPASRLAELDVPTLILAWTGDRSHPVSVARHLGDTLPRAELDITGADLSGWPALVADFLAGLPPWETP